MDSNNPYILLTPRSQLQESNTQNNTTSFTNLRNRSKSANETKNNTAKTTFLRRRGTAKTLSMEWQTDVDEGTSPTFSMNSSSSNDENESPHHESIDEFSNLNRLSQRQHSRMEMEDSDSEKEAYPIYICKLHDPKPLLDAEHVRSNRITISPCGSTLANLPTKSMDLTVNKFFPIQFNPKQIARRLSEHGNNRVFHYVIQIGLTQQQFECTPAQLLKVYKTLMKDPNVAKSLYLLEPHLFQRGLLKYLMRYYATSEQLIIEVTELLEAISDVDEVLLHPAYLSLLGIDKSMAMYQELELLVASHTKNISSRTRRKTTAEEHFTDSRPKPQPIFQRVASTPAYFHDKSEDPVNNSMDKDEKAQELCLCDLYRISIDQFGKLIAEISKERTDGARSSTVACESLIRMRGVLSYYTDTIYVIDKRNFRPTKGLKKCAIYGFGRRKLFEVVRVGRKKWSLQQYPQGIELFTLNVDRYMDNMKSYHMVALKRVTADRDGDGLKEETVCFVKKSKVNKGYSCMLVSEVMTTGQVTTSITLDHFTAMLSETNIYEPVRQYITMSELSGVRGASAQEPTCSSILTVPMNPHKHLQRLRVSKGSDVLTFIALALTYDILVSKLTYWSEKRY